MRNNYPIAGPTPGTQSRCSQPFILYTYARSMILAVCCCKELNLQHNVDLSGAPLHQTRTFDQSKVGTLLYYNAHYSRLYYQILSATTISVHIHIFRQTWSSCHISDRWMAAGDFLHHQTCLVSPSSGAPAVSNPFSSLVLSMNLIPLLVVRCFSPSTSCATRPF